MGKISPVNIMTETYSSSIRWAHLLLPFLIILTAITGVSNYQFTGDITGQGDINAVQGDMQAFWMGLVAQLAIGIAMFVLALSTIERVLAGDSAWLKEGIIRGGKRFLPAAIGFVIYILAVAGGTILLVIPGLMLLYLLFMIFPMVVIDGRGPFESTKGSWKLVWGNGWRLFGANLLVFLPMLLAFMIIGISFGILSTDTNSMEPVVVSWSDWRAWLWVALTAVSWLIMNTFYVIAYDALQKAKGEHGDAAA